MHSAPEQIESDVFAQNGHFLGDGLSPSCDAEVEWDAVCEGEAYASL